MKFGVINRVTDGFFRYQAWPTVAKDEKGVLYAASSGHRLGHVCPFGKDLLYISHDEGESWLGPIIANDTYMDDRDAGLIAWGDGQLLLSWFAHPGEFMDGRIGRNPEVSLPMSIGAREMWRGLPSEEKPSGSFIKLSQDGGKTWSERIRVPLTAPHGPIRRKDGSFLYFGRSFHAEELGYEPKRVYAAESRDGGKTWEKLGIVPIVEGVEHDRFCEPHVVELPDGTLLGAMRVNRIDKVNCDNEVYTTFSNDGGKTWSVPQCIGQVGAPPHLLLHSSGAIVMTTGRRIAPCEERAYISRDGGKTWSAPITISQESPDWDLGYPSSVELSDGSILTVYYQKFPGDSYNSLLSTRWELPAK